MVLLINDPTGIRTPVSTVKGWCPRPLDDGARSTNATNIASDKKTAQLCKLR
jgi:hypothetical protein